MSRMLKNILYIGNKLSSPKSNVSSISTLGPLLEQEHYTVYYASAKVNKLARLFDMVRQVVLLRHRVDVVLIDTYSTWNFYYALVVSQLCRLFGLRYILSLNGGNLPYRLQKSPKWSNLLFKPAYRMVSPSLYLKTQFKQYGYPEVTYIPNNLLLAQYPFQEKTYHTVKLLWVRSFSKIYNPSMAVRVLKQLLDDGVAASLCMVGPDTGDGSLQDTKALAELLGVRVTFTGKLSKPEWIALAQDHNMFINTTNFDNAPVSVIEAMALGLAVVSTNVGGMPYLITHGQEGVLVPPEAPEAMANAIKTLATQTAKTKAMAVSARKKVERFDWPVVKTQWFALLQ
ncbi:MAG: glycosyltransferase family 4 protein [Algicola sp.]|nr:glycosyltransferase family 4 protein [Algicola sp.]